MLRSYGRGTTYKTVIHKGTPYEREVWQAARSEQYTDDETGARKRRRFVGTGSTEREALQRMDASVRRHIERTERALSALRAGEEPTEVGRTQRAGNRRITLFSDVCEEWHRTRNPESVSEVVRLKDKRIVDTYLVPTFGNKDVKDITRQDLEEFFFNHLTGLRNKSGKPLLGEHARVNIQKIASRIFDRAILNEHITRNPVKGIARPKPQKQELEVSKFAGMSISLMKILRTTNHEAYCRYLFQYLGIRQSERLGITWDCVHGLNTKKPVLVIKQQLDKHGGLHIKPTTKSEAGQRRIPLAEPFISALRDEKKKQELRKESGDWEPRSGLENLVFTTPTGGPISHVKDTEIWHKILETNGYPYWRGHLNRNITATILAQIKPALPMATVREILGHSTEAMSYYYIRVSESSKREAIGEIGKAIHRE